MIRVLAWCEAAFWTFVVHVVLVALRPLAILADLVGPRLRPLRVRAGQHDRRTP